MLINVGVIKISIKTFTSDGEMRHYQWHEKNYKKNSLVLMSAKILTYNPNFPGAGEPGVFLSLFLQVSSGQCYANSFFFFNRVWEVMKYWKKCASVFKNVCQ